MQQNEQTIKNALRIIDPEHESFLTGNSIWMVGEVSVHARYRTKPKKGGKTFAFNLNPNSLQGDYELWICGQAQDYYLLPKELVQSIYTHPDGYVDHHHPEIRVADIRVTDHRCLYARGGTSLDLASYFRATFSN
ncbi:MAG: hypothetical protein WD075_05145 [Rhodospirillales bacterium]